MKRPCHTLILTCGLLPALLLLPGAGIYKHVDDHGNVTYSDQPAPGSQGLELEAPSSYSPPPFRQSGGRPDARPDSEHSTRRSEAESGQSEAQDQGYRSVRILSPENDAVVRNNQGNVTVMAVTEPTLHEGHTLQLLLNGEPRGEPQERMAFRLSGIYRGEYRVQVRVLAPNGRVVAESPTNTFYMHQASRQIP